MAASSSTSGGGEASPDRSVSEHTKQAAIKQQSTSPDLKVATASSGEKNNASKLTTALPATADIDTAKYVEEPIPESGAVLKVKAKKGDDDASDDDGDRVLEADTLNEDHNQLDASRRKRDREGSLEPSLTPSRAETIPTKKNRLQSDLVAEAAKSALASSPPRNSNVEGEKVGQIRKRVQDLNWKQRKEGSREQDHDDSDKDEEGDEGADKEVNKEAEADDEDDDNVVEQKKGNFAEKKASDIEVTKSTASKPSSQPSFASFAKSPGFASKSNRGESFLDSQKQTFKTTPSASAFPTAAATTTTTKTAAATIASPISTSAPPRTQPTFSSFSKSSSPFNSATASVAGPSWLAGKSGSLASGGGIKPSSLGSMPGNSKSHSEHSDSKRDIDVPSPSPVSASTPPPPQLGTPSSKGLGFGAFAASNPFASSSKSKLSSSRTSSPAAGDSKVSGDGGDDTVGEASVAADSDSNTAFDEALKQGGRASASGGLNDVGHQRKVETQLDKGHVDLRTGEEDETSVASVRAKLFIMAEDKSWKERGTGTVRCNVSKRDCEGSGARLVMRSEGVLRLILNIKLFKGMKINLEQDRFLRIVAFDDAKPVHYALRIGNASAASQFYRAVQSQIPTQDDISTAHIQA